MLKSKSLKLKALIIVTLFLSVAIIATPSNALISQNITSWFTNSDTNVASSAVDDLYGNGQKEIVTGGYFNDGTRWNAQLAVWNSSTMSVINTVSWFWTSDTQITSVAIANLTGGSTLDIVAGGAYFDGTRWVAQLTVWNASTLALENVKTWYWTGDTQISSVAVANITHSAALDIVTGGSYFDGVRWVAQLAVWNSATLALENVAVWYWSQSTYINSVATGDINGNGVISIVTGGTYFDGTRWNAQLAVWNGATLTLNSVVPWYWTSNTEVNTVAVANITGGPVLSIVTGGDYFDLTRTVAQLVVWNGATLAAQIASTWYTVSNTAISSIAIANYSGGANLDVISGSTFNDGQKNNAQLVDWNGGTLAKISSTNWFFISNTEINSVNLANLGLGNRVVAVGQFYDNVRASAQISIWG